MVARAMPRLLWRELRTRWGRVLLSVAAVAGGVAFVTGVQVLSDTVGRSTGSIIADALGGKGAIVRSTTTQTTAGALVRQTVPDALLDDVAQDPHVENVYGAVQGFGRLIGSDNRPLDPGVVPTMVVNWIDDPAVSIGHLATGRAPQKAGEIVIDPRTARDGHWDVGSTVRIQGSRGVSKFRVVGLGSLGSARNDLGIRVVMMTTAEAQFFTGSDDQLTYLAATPVPGTSPEQLVASLSQTLPGDVEAITARQFAVESVQQVDQYVQLTARFIQAFGVIGLVVGGLTIANTFTIIVAQRSRRLALLRAAGASRAQVARLVLAEAAAIGVMGAITGVALGVLAAWAALRLVGRVLTVDGGFPVVSWWTLAWAVALGVITALLATIVPAVRSSRIPPVAAITDADTDHDRVTRGRVVLGWVTLASGVAATVAAVWLDQTPWRSVVFPAAAAVAIIGLVLLGPVVVAPLIKVIGAPLRRVPIGAMAVANALRHPKRTTATATALALGVAVVAMVSVLVDSVTASATGDFATRVSADVVVDGGLANPLTGGIPEGVAEKVAADPSVAELARFRIVPAQVRSKDLASTTGDQLVGGVDVPAFFSLINVDVSAGAVGQLDGNAVAVSRTTAESQRWQLGDPITVFFPQLGDRTFTIGMIFDATLPAVSVLFPIATLDDVSSAAFKQDSQLYLKTAPGYSAARMIERVNKILSNVSPASRARTVSGWLKSGTRQVGTAARFVYALLAFAIVLSLIGIANALSMATMERERELAVARAVGLTRRQLVRLVTLEGAVIAATGTVLGLVAGAWFGGGLLAIVQQRTAVGVHLPLLLMVAVGVGGVVAGAIAALLPALQAARRIHPAATVWS